MSFHDLVAVYSLSPLMIGCVGNIKYQAPSRHHRARNCIIQDRSVSRKPAVVH